MKSIQSWFEDYGESHQNPINKAIHWICIPLIVFSLIGLIWSIPHDYLSDNYSGIFSEYFNWSSIFIFVVICYYILLSYKIALGMIIFSLIVLYGTQLLSQVTELWKVSLIIFIVAWIGQFIGHKIEGKKPSFFQDIQFLLIGPAWLIGFIYRRFNIRY